MWYPQTSLVVLRIVVGAWFVKALWTKVVLAWAAGVLPYPAVSSRFLAFQPKRVAEFASNNPIEWYKHFLETTVLPHASVFATLQTYGEIAVGFGLLLGLLTRLSAGIGLFLTVNYGLATQWMSFGQQGFHVLLSTSMVLFLMSGAGRLWGIDERLLPLAKRFPWLRLLL